MTYLFLDTNIYLHYINFQQIPWKEILNIKDDITIIVPHKVIEEIDYIKDREKGKIQARAKSISKKFSDILINNDPCSILLKYMDDSTITDFQLYNLNPNTNDDHIILSILNYNINGNEEKYLVAADNNIILKAKSKGIKFHKIEDKYRLNDEKSEDEKQIINLKSQLDQFINRIPKPDIVFLDNKIFWEIIKPVHKDIDKETQTLILHEKKKYPYDNTYNTDDYLNAAMKHYTSHLYGRKNAQEVTKYNNGIDIYLSLYEQYIHQIIEQEIISENMIPIKLFYTNTGNKSTGKTFIDIIFPDKIELFNDPSICIEEKLIKPELYYNGEVKRNYISRKMWNLNNSIIQKHFTFEFDNLLHGQSIKLDFKEGIYLYAKTCSNFQIGYSISCENLPNKIQGKLNIVFK